jgi:uncharacterized protein (TIGR02186 family)
MTMLRVLSLLFCLSAPVAAQETVVTGLSTDNIALTADFSGSELFVFGAIRRDGPTPEGASPLDIIITIKGPEKPVTVRRKSRRFGIWINTESVRVRQAPSFYAIATTRPLEGLLSETERLRYQIGMDQAVRRVGGHETLTDTSDFAEALVRLRENQDLYDVLDGDVSVVEQTLFQTRIQMPANIVEGDYAAQFFLVRDKEVISEGSTIINVEKAGIERWIYNLSRQQPLVYGILSVLVALIAGWLAATVFRLLRR